MTRLMTTALVLFALATPALAETGNPAKGEKEFNKCKACHTIASADQVIVKGGRTGPDLYGVIGRQAGTVEGFRYGSDIVAAGQKGLIWDTDNLQAYVSDPREFLRDFLGDPKANAKMTFRLRDHQADIAAYLSSVSPDAPADKPAE